MKKTIVALMCIVSLVIMTACGGSPLTNHLKKIDTAIEKLEKANKKGEKLSKEDMEQIGKDLEEPLKVLNEALENDEIGGVTKTENRRQGVEAVHPRHQRRAKRSRPERADEGCQENSSGGEKKSNEPNNNNMSNIIDGIVKGLLGFMPQDDPDRKYSMHKVN